MLLNNIKHIELFFFFPQKLPSKTKKMFSEFETFMEPARNHRNYRIAVSKLTSPIIPFMNLLIQGEALKSLKYTLMLLITSKSEGISI